jgi:YVTN family beta-propeller protein
MWAAFRPIEDFFGQTTSGRPAQTTSLTQTGTPPLTATSAIAAPTNPSVIATIPVDPAQLAVSPDGKTIYATNLSDGTVSVIDTATMTVIRTIPVDLSAYGVAVSPDGTHVYVNGVASVAQPNGTSVPEGAVSVVDTSTNSVIGSPIADVNQGFGDGIVVSPDGKRVYAGGLVPGNGGLRPGQAAVTVIDTSTDTAVGNPIPVGDPPTTYPSSAQGIAISPNGAHVYVTSTRISSSATTSGTTSFTYESTVTVIDTASDTVVGSPITISVSSAQSGVSGVAVSPNGSRVYVTSTVLTSGPNGSITGSTGVVTVIDTATNTIVGNPITVGTNASALAVSPDGTRVYVSSIVPSTSADGTTTVGGAVSVIDTATNTVIGNPIAVGSQPRWVAFNPSGTRAYVANFGDNTISIIDTGGNTGGNTGGGNTGNPFAFVAATINIIGAGLTAAIIDGSQAFGSFTTTLAEQVLTLVDIAPFLGVASQDIGAALGLAGRAATFAGEGLSFLPSAINIVSGLSSLLTNEHPVTGALTFGAGLLGVAGGVFLFLPYGQPIGLGLIAIGAGLGEASVLLNTFTPGVDSAVNTALQGVANGITQFASSVEDTTNSAINTVENTTNNLVNGVENFASNAVNGTENFVSNVAGWLHF